jgi:uncharacterized membrane protein YraQ (UPF0718 family)
MEQILKVGGFIIDSFIHLWPYLIITIPLAVLVKLSGASKYINKALNKNPLVSVFLATVVGAFSPFCSCGVIPVIASLLIGGVPLAPVMSFWIASPSMDPEIFFLSTAAIGWKLSVWRLAATFTISLLSGYTIHFLSKKGLLEATILKEYNPATARAPLGMAYTKTSEWLKTFFTGEKRQKRVRVQLKLNSGSKNYATVNCCIPVEQLHFQSEIKNDRNTDGPCNNPGCQTSAVSFRKRLLNETWKATALVAKFMTVAFLINALIQFYVPREFISNLLGGTGFRSVLIASFTGIPFYTSNITALPLISGLLEMGMNEGAALAFLISGPMTTLPAMAAVWGLVRRKIFVLYVSFALIGALVFGTLINFLN